MKSPFPLFLGTAFALTLVGAFSVGTRVEAQAPTLLPSGTAVRIEHDNKPPVKFIPLRKEEKPLDPLLCLSKEKLQEKYKGDKNAYRDALKKQAKCAENLVEATMLSAKIADVKKSISELDTLLQAIRFSQQEMSGVTTLGGETIFTIPAGENAEKEYNSARRVAIQCLPDAKTAFPREVSLGTISTSKLNLFTSETENVKNIFTVARQKNKETQSTYSTLIKGRKISDDTRQMPINQLSALQVALGNVSAALSKNALTQYYGTLESKKKFISISVSVKRLSNGEKIPCDTPFTGGGWVGKWVKGTIIIDEAVYEDVCLPEARLLQGTKEGFAANIAFFLEKKAEQEELLAPLEKRLAKVAKDNYGCEAVPTATSDTATIRIPFLFEGDDVQTVQEGDSGGVGIASEREFVPTLRETPPVEGRAAASATGRRDSAAAPQPPPNPLLGKGGEVKEPSYLIIESFDPNNPWGEIVEIVGDEEATDEITRSDLVENKADAVMLSVDGATDAVGVKKGEEAEVKWEGDETIVSCRGSWSPANTLPASGTAKIVVDESSTLTLACLDSNGAAVTKSVIVSAVNPPLLARLVNWFTGRAASSASGNTPVVSGKGTATKAGKILVLPVDFLDSKARPYTREQLHSLVFGGQVQKFFEEQSYGRFVLDGDTSDWTTIQRNGALNTSCGAVTDADIGEVISARTINLSSYSTVLLFVINALSEDCGGESSSHVINGRTYTFARALVSVSPDVHPAGYFPQPFPWNRYDFGVSHELGHALGANHANGLDCGAEQTSGTCVLREYQNYFDVMGAGKYGLHFNAVLKDWLGWLSPENMLVITQSGRYTLNPFETREGVKVAKVAVPGSASGEYVYAEYRTGAGFDAKMAEPSSGAPGLFINVVRKGPQGAFAPYLVDANASALSWDTDVKDAALSISGPRSVFSDPTRGIIIGPVVSQEANRITFDVKIETLETPECVRGVPALIKNFINPNFVFPDKASLNAGESGVISMGFSNTDYPVCGASQFKVIPLLPPLWNYKMILGESPFTAWSAEEEITVNPGDADSKNINFSVPKEAAPGAYLVKYKVVNVTSGLKAEKEFKVTVLSPMLRVFSPKAGEIWNAGALMNVAWSATGSLPTAAPIRISLWRGRATTTAIHNQLIQDITTPNDGSEVWVIPPNLRPGFYFLELACADSNIQCVSGASPAFRVVGSEASAFMKVDVQIDGSNKPPPIKRGTKLTVSWEVSGVGSCYPNFSAPGMGTIRENGKAELVFDSVQPKVYELQCYNAENNRTVSDSVVVTPLR